MIKFLTIDKNVCKVEWSVLSEYIFVMLFISSYEPFVLLMIATIFFKKMSFKVFLKYSK